VVGEKKGKYKCKLCNKDLSIFHLKETHEKDYIFTQSAGFIWIQEISESFNFIESLNKRNIDKEMGSFFIKDIYDKALSCRTLAIKNLGILVKPNNEAQSKIKSKTNSKTAKKTVKKKERKNPILKKESNNEV